MATNLKLIRSRVLIGALFVAAIVAICVAFLARPDVSRSVTPTLNAKSTSLASSAPIAPQQPGNVVIPAGDLSARAMAIAAVEVPVPPGYNAAATLNWANQNGGAGLGEDDVRFLLQHNAICDWMRYAAEGDLSDDDVAILRQIPEWSAVRGGQWTQQTLKPALDAVIAGDRGLAKAFVSTGPCRPRPAPAG